MPKVQKRRKADPDISLDQAIKDLLTEFPVDAWRFLLPDLARKLGNPIACEAKRSEARKYDFRKKGWVMDLPIHYSFAGGNQLVVVVLIEHWATSRSVNLHRTARYVLDLMERYPERLVIPVALVTDLHPGPVMDRLQLPDPIHPEPILTFRHRVQLVADHELKAWSRRTNVIATAMFAAMKGPMSVTAKAELGLARLEATLDTAQVMKIAALLFRVGKLTDQEQEDIMATKSKLPEPHLFKVLQAKGKAEGRAEGRAEGEQSKGVASALKLLEHGVSWDIITDSTGIRPADLKKLATRPKAKVAAKK